MIQATNIVKRFGELEVLRGVDLTVNAGEIVSIVGASGAGKTTLLQILGTLDVPDAGEVSIGGQSTTGLSRRELSAFRNAHLGFVFQFHRLLPEFNALENVLMPAWIAGKSTDESRMRAKQLLEELGMGHRMEHNPAELSGGEQQRVAVARALMNAPSVLLADEPSGNLDSENAALLHDLFFELRDRLGQTIVLVTHNEQLAQRADRMLRMADGKFV
ncbi:MAG: ABC transporter ATP-binding protein [Bacteroidota bacterium]|nr:ABC transporter ATP-binding protein [Flavobacteriales bacterium]MEC7477877.1 ABC transporter ATP-binding protein [Bacteroidota bacterium]MEC8400255.1 ABC transporter ATP-binding protein [Bacteroidota bacterium]HBS19645.1 lipoprotein-releasing system ATP-binding protein LolD [Flavobacteriales bacterium]HCL45893.1 lipoprotein-releasing system ATP-binding protein LolD [Flavobacteriales bacterium]